MILLRFFDKAIQLPGLKGYEAPVKDISKPDMCQGFEIAANQAMDQQMESPAKVSGNTEEETPQAASTKRTFGRFPIRNHESFEKDASQISDEEIDKNFKILLQKKEHGKYLDTDTVAHLEYFMNTLSFDHKCQTDNPFQNPSHYPALQFKPNDLDVTMESVAEESSGSSSDSMIDEQEKEEDRLKRTADLIDVDIIGINTQDIGQLTTPTPKKQMIVAVPSIDEPYVKNQSIKSAQSPMKQLVKNEIKRQSVMLVKNMTILERHSILINPQSNLEMIKKKVKYDRKSILSNKKMASLSKSSSINSRSSSFIDDIKIQEKIVKTSINQLLPKSNQWYPNYKNQQRYSAVFTGSPEPKQMSSIGIVNKSNFASGSMFVPGDFGSQRNASSVCFKMNPIQTAPGFCEGIIDDQEMEDMNQSSAKPQNTKVFSGDSIEALKEKTTNRFQIPS